jgi:hypothetical protein
MLRVLFIDRSNPVFVALIRSLAEEIRDLPVQLVFLSDKERSAVLGNLEIINVYDVQQRKSIAELERDYGFSVHRALVPERAFFDYSTFRRCQRYSDLSLDEIGRRILPYLNAFDFLIREKIDMIIEGQADTFIPSLAGRIAAYYGKPFYMNSIFYWWPDGLLFADRMDQTSSEIDRLYLEYRADPTKIDRQRLAAVFAEKRFKAPRTGYDWKMRIRQVRARLSSFEPPSPRNWICRRLSAVVARFAIRNLVKSYDRPQPGEEYVLYPLHVSPEAMLLGSSPELADQFGLIKNISMNLPFGVRLYVKEHPGQNLGLGLDYGFYRRLTSLPNVRYLEASADLNGMLSDSSCLAVAVINGTVGLEAAMQFHKPVFVFGAALFGAADCFIKPKNFSDLHQSIQDIRSGRFVFDEEALSAILQAIDASVVRADVDFSETETWSEGARAGNAIYRQFLLKCLSAKDAAQAAPILPEAE